MSKAENERWLNAQGRVPLMHGPTPLEPMDRLSEELGGPRIWLKRDDCTGLATGGNKTRKLEFLMAEAIEQNADSIVTYGAVQSNHARQTAAACAKLGLSCHLVLSERVHWPHHSYVRQGNVQLDKLFGAHLHICPVDNVSTKRETLLRRLAEAGRRVFEIPAGGSSLRGALGYSQCLQELISQCGAQGIAHDMIVHASASGGTQAGLVFGRSLLDVDCHILGINVFHRDPQTLKDRVSKLAAGMFNAWPTVTALQPLQIDVNHAYLGDGYGLPTQACIEAITMAAQLEGLLFDPVYSGKALAAMIDQINLGNFSHFNDVVLVHTGGSASLSAYIDAFET
jgi:L-cysteate sulfo-lyase